NMKKILQNISIVGFENIAFHEALLATHQVYRLFEQSHPPGAMKPFQFSNIQAEPSFVAQARFLTPAQNNPFSEAEHDIRIIEFQEVTEDESGTSIVADLEDPCMIRPGHLVELFVNFRTITTGGLRPIQLFLVKLDRVVIINKIGSRLLSNYDIQYARGDQQSQDEAVCIPKKRRFNPTV
ncbi:hypothetical protein K443DRAFT_89092, partial [Laccaria amethystina LaAM-08-1]